MEQAITELANVLLKLLVCAVIVCAGVLLITVTAALVQLLVV